MKIYGRKEILYSGQDRAAIANRAATIRPARNDSTGWLLPSPGSLFTKGTQMGTTWLRKVAAASLQIGGQICGLALVLAAFSGAASAAPPSFAPEIDPGSMQAALMLLGGGVMLVADRFRRRSR